MGKNRHFSPKRKADKVSYYASDDCYSDDYRLSPDYSSERKKYSQDERVYSPRRPCPEGQICCSRETCSPRKRDFSQTEARAKKTFVKSPERRNASSSKNASSDITSNKKPSKRGMEIIVVNDRHSHLHSRKASSPSCSSCSSCDSCYSGDSSYTKIEFQNDVFSSPMESTEASFFHTSLSPQSKSKEPLRSQRNNRRPKQVIQPSEDNRRGRSPRRRGGSYAGDYKHRATGEWSRKERNIPTRAAEGHQRRARSFNGKIIEL